MVDACVQSDTKRGVAMLCLLFPVLLNQPLFIHLLYRMGRRCPYDADQLTVQFLDAVQIVYIGGADIE